MARIPRIARLEFIIDYLEGLSRGLDIHALEQMLADRKFQFEKEKYRALGRGAPFSEKQKKVLSVGSFKLSDCEKMCSTLGLVTQNGSIRLSETGRAILSDKEADQKIALGMLYLSRYPEFSNLLMRLKESPFSELQLLDSRHASDKLLFREKARSFGIDVDAISFNHMRDLMSQIGFINWFPEKNGADIFSRLYLTCLLEPISGSPENRNGNALSYGSKLYSIRLNDCTPEEFAIKGWTEYMELTNDVQWKPVFYADLKTKTCYRLRIPDKVFDRRIQELINHPSDFKTVWSAGTVPRSVYSASLLKNIPPKATDEDYMVYIMMGKN